MIPFKVYPPLDIGFLKIYPWGIMVTLAFIVGGVLAFREARRKGIDKETILDLFLLILLATVVGSRLVVVFEYLDHFIKNPLEIFAVWEGGMAFWGGFLLSLVLIFFYCRRKNINLSLIGDVAVPSVAIGIAIGRVGNFLSGHHLGKITDLPWAIDYFGTMRHPVALYAILNALILYLFLILLRRKIRQSGLLFLVFLFWYSGVRFFLDFLRNDDLPVADPRYFGLTFSQYVCAVVFLVISVYLLTILYRLKIKKGGSKK